MKVYLVGGAVRDQLLHKAVHERDYVVVGATPEQMLALGYRQVGKDFPVFLHPQTNEEYALARTERKSGAGYTGFTVFADPSVTLEEDLFRRDLTVNAIAQDESGELIDPYGGLHDIRERWLRHISPAFTEDPLRILRVARFAARFAGDGFKVAPETLALMQQISQNGELAHLSAERVWQETEKALATASPQVYWGLLHQVQAMQPWFSELEHNIDEQGLERIAEVCAEDRSLYAWALSCSRITEEQLHALHQRLRVPKRYQVIALDALQVSWSPAQVIDAQWVFDLISKLDGWRQPERVSQLLKLWRLLGMTRVLTQQIEAAYDAAKAIQAREVMQRAAQAGTPLQGAEINQAVLAERLQCIQQHWSLDKPDQQNNTKQ